MTWNGQMLLLVEKRGAGMRERSTLLSKIACVLCSQDHKYVLIVPLPNYMVAIELFCCCIDEILEKMYCTDEIYVLFWKFFPVLWFEIWIARNPLCLTSWRFFLYVWMAKNLDKAMMNWWPWTWSWWTKNWQIEG